MDAHKNVVIELAVCQKLEEELITVTAEYDYVKYVKQRNKGEYARSRRIENDIPPQPPPTHISPFAIDA
jgi:hypothetical protein